MEQKKLIIFDFDGVIVDTGEMANEYLLTKYPTMTRELMQEVLAGNFHEEMAKVKLVHQSAAKTPEEAAAMSAAYTEKKMNAELFDGIHDLLKRLHEKGYTMAINTSALEKNATPILERLGILPFFDFVATSEVSKSKVEKFRVIEEKCGVPNDRTVFVTDTLGDEREAKVAGVRTIGVTWGAHDRSFLTRDENPLLAGVVDTIGELETLVDSL